MIFGKNVTAATPGSAQGLYLIVSDIEAARSELIRRGVKVSDVFHGGADVHVGTDEPFLSGRIRVAGPDPKRGSYRSFASFSDPDGNGWLFQEITERLPGRVTGDTTFTSSSDLAAHYGVQRPRMASMKSVPAASTMRTGPTGTPNTSSASRPASHRFHNVTHPALKGRSA